MNYYEILGVEEDATQEQIKAAYHSLAKNYHPDVTDAPNASTFFRLIHEAYETLSDSSKRREYDNKNFPEEPPFQEEPAPPKTNVQYEASQPEPVVNYSNNEPSTLDDVRRKDIPVIDSLIALVGSAIAAHSLAHIHPAFCVLIGLAVVVILGAIFMTRIGSWIISIIYSILWGLLVAFIVFSIAHEDWIWFWVSGGITFFISLMQHKYKLS